MDTAPEDTAADVDLESADLYLNRELTWLAFNQRVLQMAADEHTPLLERVKFLAIVSSNLDEFFMKRIGGLKQQIAAGINTVTVDGKTPLQQVEECQAEVRKIHHEQNRIYLRCLDCSPNRASGWSSMLTFRQTREAPCGNILLKISSLC